MTPLLEPTLDVVFKLLFAHERNRNLLISLLTAVLEPSDPIVEITILNPEIDKDAIRDKGVVLDVRVRLADRRLINVEMQSQNHPAPRSRTLLYWARLYAAQLQRGDPYEELAPTVSLFILDFVELPTEGYHSEFRLLEVEEHHAYSENIVLHVLELPKLPNVGAWKTAEPTPTDEPLLSKWGRFLRAKSENELEKLAMTDPIFREAKSALERLSQDPKAQELAEERRIGAYFHELGLRLEKQKAAAEGRTEGHMEGRMEGRTEGRMEGRAEGHMEGRAEGMAEGRRLLLEELLTSSFGALPHDLRKRLEGASEAELSLWAKRVRSARTLDDVFAPDE